MRRTGLFLFAALAWAGCSVLTDFGDKDGGANPGFDGRIEPPASDALPADARSDAPTDAPIDAPITPFDAQPDAPPPDGPPAVDAAPDAPPSECSSLAQCDDHNACTLDACGSDGRCVHRSVACDDGLACTLDSCDVAMGCVHTPNHALCNDGADCSVDTCDPVAGCVRNPDAAKCDDGDACTSDLCVVTPLTAHCEHTTISGCLPCKDNKNCPGESCAACTVVGRESKCKYECHAARCELSCEPCKVNACNL